jgi:type IV pilus assembly protein PilW
MKTNSVRWVAQSGFSLVELMVALVIGMLTTLVIMQTFAAYEGQKRTTSGSSDAQTNGALALYSIERELMMAGYGLPLFSTKDSPMRCYPTTFTVDHDNLPATPAIGFEPIQITDGGSNGESDTVTIRYASSAVAQTSGGVPMNIGGVSVTDIIVDVALGCNDKDVAMLINGSACAMTLINGTPTPIVGPPKKDKITLASATHAVVGGTLACLGRWSEVSYRVGHQDNRYWLETVDSRSTTFPSAQPRQSEIVNIQAQYGISKAAKDFEVSEWVDAVDPWDAPFLSDRNRIKAVRIAVVARSALAEKDKVTTACSSQFCAEWEDPVRPGLTRDSPPMKVAIPGADWENYRYRTYQTIVPLRNLIWASPSL